MTKKVLITTAVVVLAIILFHPGRHAKYYNFIPVSDVVSEYVRIKVQYEQPNLRNCTFEFYSELILTGDEISRDDIYNFNNFTTPLNGNFCYIHLMLKN